MKLWLQELTKNGVPFLICLTHADVLYLECAEEGRRDDIGRELQVCVKLTIAHRVIHAIMYILISPDHPKKPKA